MSIQAVKPWVLGLTGGIGSGKSAAAEHFTALGIEVVDADQASRWVVEPGQPALAQLAEHFGAAILSADGRLDRAALRTRIFDNPEQRRWVEALLHPLIGAAIEQRLAAATSPYAIYMAPLLVETGQRRGARRVLVIDVPEALQRERTLQRDGVSEAQVQAILAAQATREQRLAAADDVIVNDRDLAWLHAEVQRLHAVYLSLAGADA